MGNVLLEVLMIPECSLVAVVTASFMSAMLTR